MAYTWLKPKSFQHNPTHSTTWAITVLCHNLSHYLLYRFIPLHLLNKYLFIYLFFIESYTKVRHAYNAMEDNGDSTSNSSQEESEEVNLYLMADYESSSSSQASSFSSKDKMIIVNYCMLLRNFIMKQT